MHYCRIKNPKLLIKRNKNKFPHGKYFTGGSNAIASNKIFQSKHIKQSISYFYYSFTSRLSNFLFSIQFNTHVYKCTAYAHTLYLYVTFSHHATAFVDPLKSIFKNSKINWNNFHGNTGRWLQCEMNEHVSGALLCTCVYVNWKLLSQNCQSKLQI